MSAPENPTPEELLRWGRAQDAKAAHDARKAREREQAKK